VAQIVRDFAASGLKQTSCWSFPVNHQTRTTRACFRKTAIPKPALSGNVNTLVLELSKWKYLSVD
jgi:hypothetical protein